MKKKLFCFFVFTIMLLPMYSAPYSSELSRAISLQGAYGEVVSIEFEEIAAQTQSYLIGMPFNIQDQSVQSDSGAGRVISRWNIIANTPFYLKLSCDGLYHENYSEIENYSPLQFLKQHLLFLEPLIIRAFLFSLYNQIISILLNFTFNSYINIMKKSCL